MAKDRLTYPPELAPEIIDAGLRVDARIDLDPVSTIDGSRAELALIEGAERLAGRRFHKGHPLHNLGVALYATSPYDARVYFMAAHVEDARTWARRPARPDGYLAAKMLAGLFRFTTGMVTRLSRRARLDPDQPPIETAAEFAEAEWLPQSVDALPTGQSSDDLAAMDPEDRVFVGGSYRYAWDRIVTMARGVIAANREPIIVANFEPLSEEEPRDKSFRFLDACPRAVFDVTVQDSPGHWPEIERIAQVTPKPTLLAHNTYDPGQPWSAPGTFPTAKDIPALDYLPFDTPDTLRRGVTNWLLVKHPRLPRPGTIVIVSIEQAIGSATPTARGSNTTDRGGSVTLPRASGILPEE